jgi:hypothetical protein
MSWWSWFWTTFARTWTECWLFMKGWWFVCGPLFVAALVALIFHGTKQPVISTIPTYAAADAATVLPNDGGSLYCSSLSSALVQYSAYSRICAWTTFFLGVLLGGIAVVVGSDDQVPTNSGLGARLVSKHRNIGLLLLASLSWITAYSSFVRIRTAAETVAVLNGHMRDAEVRRANGRALLNATSPVTLQAATPEASTAAPAASAPPAGSTAPLSSARSAGAAEATPPALGSDAPRRWRDGSSPRSPEVRQAYAARVDRFNEALDRELFAKCIDARGAWEVSRTKSLEFAESVALGRAKELLDQRREAEKVVESADEAHDKKAAASENVKNTETLRAELRALLDSEKPTNQADITDSAKKLANAAEAAAKAAEEVERATSRAVNLTAGIDPAMAAALRTHISDLQAQVKVANQAAVDAQKAASGEGPQAAGKVVEEAERAAVAATQALELATDVNNTVQAAAAAPVSKP